jgi:hypothetical protein
MALYSVRGAISQLGQCTFNNDFCIYAFIEIATPDGGRRLLKKILVCVDVQAAMDVGTEGEFFFDDLFVSGRGFLAQFWGLKTDERFVIDSVNMRKALAFVNLRRGILYTPLLFVGFPELLAGIGQAWSLINQSANRGRFFRRTPSPLPKSDLDVPTPERVGYV